VSLGVVAEGVGIRLSVEPADEIGSNQDWVVIDHGGGMVL
jgi:hypothetical protein